MPQVKFINPNETIRLFGREPLTSANLTWEKYESLMKDFPDLKSKFEVIETKPEKQVKNETPKPEEK